MPDDKVEKDDDKKVDETVKKKSARQEFLESMGDQQEELRHQEIAEGLNEDPGAARLHKSIEEEQEENRTQAEAGALQISLCTTASLSSSPKSTDKKC